MKPEEYTTCSNCNMDGPVRSMQDELPLDKPLCRKCRNAIPATVEDLINRYDKYITDLEGNRDRLQDIANLAMKAVEDVLERVGANEPVPSFNFTQLQLASENKLSKSLHRP